MVGNVQYSVGRGCIVPHYTHVFYTTHYTYRGLWTEREDIYEYNMIINYNNNNKKNTKTRNDNHAYNQFRFNLLSNTNHSGHESKIYICICIVKDMQINF